MIAIGDGFEQTQNKRTLESHYLHRYGYPSGGGPFKVEPGDQAYRRHERKLNVLFCDGHVEAPQTKQLLFDPSDAWVRKFNRDHDAHAAENRPLP